MTVRRSQSNIRGHKSTARVSAKNPQRSHFDYFFGGSIVVYTIALFCNSSAGAGEDVKAFDESNEEASVNLGGVGAEHSHVYEIRIICI